MNDLLTIKHLTQNDIFLIQTVAKLTWPITYAEILTEQQSDFMLTMMYSEKALLEQITIKKHLFFGCFESEQLLGFISIEINFANTSFCKIHKIYILPNQQGKGIGNLLLKTASEISAENNCNGLTLNVNRNNKALNFYLKNGFNISKAEDISIGNGYLMEDYVMEKVF